MARRGGALALGMAVALSVVVPTTMVQAATIERQATLDHTEIWADFVYPDNSAVLGPDSETVTFTLPTLAGSVVGPDELYFSVIGDDDTDFVIAPTTVERVASTVSIEIDPQDLFSSSVPLIGAGYYEFLLTSFMPSQPSFWSIPYGGALDADRSVRVLAQVVLDELATAPDVSLVIDEESPTFYHEWFMLTVEDRVTIVEGDRVRLSAPDGFQWPAGGPGTHYSAYFTDPNVEQAFELKSTYLSINADTIEITIPNSIPSWLRTASDVTLNTDYFFSVDDAENLQFTSMSIFTPVDFGIAPAKWKKIGTPSVSGAKVGGVATVKAGSWSPAPTSFEYQWMLDGVEIVDAIDATYEPEVADFGKSLSVEVTAKRAGYADQLRVSKAVKVAAGALSTSTPTLTGDTQVGDTLTVDEGVWEPASDFAYTWLRSGKTIKGATGDTYTLTSADRGKTIQVKVTGSAEGYKSASKTSAKTAKVGYGTLLGGTLSLTGDGIVGATLSASLEGVSPAPSKVTYQWFVNGKAVKGATKANFVIPPSALFGHVNVEAKASLAGYTSKRFVVNPGKLSIGPANLDGVTVDLPDEVVAGKTVKAAVSGQGKGATVSYQWFFDGNPIPGATKSSYKPAAADWGKTLRVAVAVAKPGYLGTYGQHTAGSVLLTYKAPKPKIVYTGTLTAGTELSVNAGTWNPEPIVAEQYQWLVGKTVVGTSPTYTVQPADKGKKITVKVTVPADSGYAALTVTSKATGKVK